MMQLLARVNGGRLRARGLCVDREILQLMLAKEESLLMRQLPVARVVL